MNLDYLRTAKWGNLRRLLHTIALAGCPSGQWEGTVNPPALPSKVQILHPPPVKRQKNEREFRLQLYSKRRRSPTTDFPQASNKYGEQERKGWWRFIHVNRVVRKSVLKPLRVLGHLCLQPSTRYLNLFDGKHAPNMSSCQ